MRALVAGQPFNATALVWGAALATVQIAIAYWLFVCIYRSTVRSGLLARYSAESVA